MVTRNDIAPISVAISSATAIGLALGFWLALPSGPAPVAAEVDPAAQMDPNLAAYQRMLAENGVSATPYVLAPAYSPPPAEPNSAETLQIADEDQDQGAASGDAEALTSSQASTDAREASLETAQPPEIPPTVELEAPAATSS